MSKSLEKQEKGGQEVKTNAGEINRLVGFNPD